MSLMIEAAVQATLVSTCVFLLLCMSVAGWARICVVRGCNAFRAGRAFEGAHVSHAGRLPDRPQRQAPERSKGISFAGER